MSKLRGFQQRISGRGVSIMQCSEDTTAHVLFVCTGNAGRSQMAQALFKGMAGDDVAVVSGGVEPWDHLHPMAVKLMAESGFDMAGQCPKHVQSFADTALDWVITIGAPARDKTPMLPGNPRRIHWDISDPADADGTADSEPTFRRTRDRIVERLPGLLDMVRGCVTARQLHLTAGMSTGIVRPSRFDPAAHLPLIAEAGFSCIELNCNFGSDDFPWDRQAKVHELARIAADTGVDIYSVHADGATLPVAEPNERQLAVDVAKAYADLAAQLGAQIVPIHAGLPDDMDKDVAMDVLRQTFEELEQHILPLPCRYAWENSAYNMSPAEHFAVLNGLNPAAFGFVFDTGHAQLADNTYDYLQLAGLRLCDLHLNGNDGRTDLHQIPGQCSNNWDGVKDALAATGYIGPLMLEVHALDRQDELPTVLKEAYRSVEMFR